MINQPDETRSAGSQQAAEPATASPSVDIRVVLFTLSAGRLHVALQPGSNGACPGLPRGLPSRHESLDTTASRIVRGATGLTEQYIEQLYTLSANPEMHDRWTIVVSYMALLSSGRGPLPSGATIWHDVMDLPTLSPTDAMVVDYAITRLRAKLGYTNIAFFLLPETFTLTELQNAYESILNRQLDKRNFRRRVTASGILELTEGKRRDGSHRPAALYRFREQDDRATYLTPSWSADE